MIGLGGMELWRNRRHVPQQEALRVPVFAVDGLDWNVLQDFDGIVTLLGSWVLDREKIVVLVCVIDPDRWLYIQVRIECRDHVRYHFLLLDSQAGGPHAINLNVQGRIARFLYDEALRNLGQAANLLLKFLCGLTKLAKMATGELNIDWSHHPQIENRVDDASRGKQRASIRNLPG